MIKIFNEYALESSILDDFKFFENKQEHVLTKNKLGVNASEESSNNANANTNAKEYSNNQSIENEEFPDENKTSNYNDSLLNNNNPPPLYDNNNNFHNGNQNLPNNLVNNDNNYLYKNIGFPLPIQRVHYGNNSNYNNFNMNNVNNMNLIYNQNNFYNIQNSNNFFNKGVTAVNIHRFGNIKSETELGEKFENTLEDVDDVEEENENNNQKENTEDFLQINNNSQKDLNARNLYLLNMENTNSHFMKNPEMLKAFLLGQTKINNHNNFELKNTEHNFFPGSNPSLEIQSNLNYEKNEGCIVQGSSNNNMLSNAGSEDSFSESL